MKTSTAQITATHYATNPAERVTIKRNYGPLDEFITEDQLIAFMSSEAEALDLPEMTYSIDVVHFGRSTTFQSVTL